MLPLSQIGGSRPTRVIEAPERLLEAAQSRPNHIALTNEPPGIPSLMDLHLGGVDVGRVTKVGQPHILDVQVVEGLVDGAVEFVALGDVSTVLP